MEFIDLKAQFERIRPRVEKRISNVLEHGKFIQGPEVDLLESRLAEYSGAAYCISCANGTDAIQIVLMALEVGYGDEVVTPSFSYVAAAEAAKLLGATPAYIDVDPGTCLIDATKLENAITPRTKAIVPVSLFGQCPDMSLINEIACKKNIPVIEDAAQSFGAQYKDKKSCNLSLAATTSFFPAKPLGCYGDGGAIFTNDKNLADLCRRIASHGQSSKYNHELVGINSRLDTLQAAVLLEKLEIFDDELAKRQSAAEFYNREILGGLDEELRRSFIDVPEVRAHGTSAWAQYTIRVKRRDEVRKFMLASGIPTNIYYPRPLHKQIAVSQAGANLPVSEQLSREVLSLPMHPYITQSDQLDVTSILMQALAWRGKAFNG